MRVAVKHGAFSTEPLIDDDGRLVRKGAGTMLVSRLLKIFDGSVLIGPQDRACDGFRMVELTSVDPRDTLIINMDVIDSIAVFQALYREDVEPSIMNFEWVDPTMYHHRVNYAAMGLSLAMFPTFCNSERTAAKVRDILVQWTVPPLADKAKIDWANLGVRLDRVHERRATSVPVVLYPAIYLYERKQPRVFMDIVERVAARTPIHVEMRLHESHLNSDLAQALAAQEWADVGLLTPTRDDYWAALSRTTAFVATALDESYGMEYVEGMLAGAIGVFPQQPWVAAILPEGYPFIYATPTEAEQLLYRAVTDPQACRAELDECVGGDFLEWIRTTHNNDNFEQALVAKVAEWFPSVAAQGAPPET